MKEKKINEFDFEEFLKSVFYDEDLEKAEDLDKFLKDLSIVRRDRFWSLFIHNSFENEGIVKNILENIFNSENKNLIFNKRKAVSYGIVISWFFTSSNRKLRDLATKTLVKIFINNFSIISEIIEKFSKVNDLYVLERVLAACYGAVLDVEEDDEFYNVAKKVYEVVFENEIISHIMIVDYARLIIFSIEERIKLDFNLSVISPPYGVKFCLENVSFKEFKENLDKDYKMLIQRIFPSYPTVVDFVKDVFDKKISKFDIFPNDTDLLNKKEFHNFQKLYESFLIKFIKNIKEIISDETVLLNEVDNAISNYTKLEREKLLFNSSDKQMAKYHFVDSFLRKYEWIAFYRLLFVVADNFKIAYLNHFYKGAWEIAIRDIDPTYLNENIKEIKLNVNFKEEENYSNWLIENEDISLWNFLNYNNFFVLNILFNRDLKANKSIKVNIKSILVKNDYFKVFKEFLKEDVFKVYSNISAYEEGILRKLLEKKIYLKEYPYQKVFRDIKKTFKIKDYLDDNVKLSAFYYDYYNNEDINFRDYAVYSFDNFIFPRDWLIKKMNLKYKRNGIWKNSENKNVFVSTNNILLADKEIFTDFLKKNKLKIIWLLKVEKEYKSPSQLEPYIENSCVKNSNYGYGYFENNKFIEKIF